MTDNAAHTSTSAAQAQTSAWSPFRSQAFIVLWGATVISNIGTWMHEVGAAWLMTSLSASALIVALVQTATTLPIFLFALPAGALADIVDRRKLLLVVQALMALLTLLVSALVFLEQMSAPLLLLFTFLLGSCAAFIAPAWQSIVPALVPRQDLQAAVALNSVGINISRALGPALAGLLIVVLGITAPFAINALSFIGVIFALFWWRPPHKHADDLPSEPILGAIVGGLRYVRHSRPLMAVLWRTFALFSSASAFWALLPLIARAELSGDAGLYGILLGAAGLGAVIGALLLPRLRRYLNPNAVVLVATLLIALLAVALAGATQPVFVALLCFIFGAVWISALSTLNVSVQTALPDWVRSRGLSIYLMVIFGAMSGGSALWGLVASISSVDTALLFAAAALVLGALVTYKARLHWGESVDLSPSMHWPAPALMDQEVAHDRSPVMVLIEYRIAEENEASFLERIMALGRVRKQLGAFNWGVLEDAARPGYFVEHFMELSWLNHLRHHRRVSGSDRELQVQVNALHEGESAPLVTHLLGVEKPQA